MIHKAVEGDVTITTLSDYDAADEDEIEGLEQGYGYK